MKNNKVETETFFRFTTQIANRLLELDLTAAEWRIWCYLVSINPFGDRSAKFSPAELMLKCRVKKSTYFATKTKFQDLGLFDFQDGVTKVFNLQGYGKQSKFVDCSQQKEVNESKILEFSPKILEQQSTNLEPDSKILESQPAKPTPDKDSRSLQTIQTIQTNQTGEGGQKNDLEENTNQLSQSKLQELPKIGSVANKVAKDLATNQSDNQRSNRDNQKNCLPTEVLEKLKELEIPLDDRVKEAIAKYDISQVYGAIAHVEETWETISNPRGVFLYQLPKQKIEKLGVRGRVSTAADAEGYTLEMIKKMYPNSWEHAAIAFGINT